jgi:hypothetical protein
LSAECRAAGISQRWKSPDCSPRISVHGFGRFAGAAPPDAAFRVRHPCGGTTTPFSLASGEPLDHQNGFLEVSPFIPKLSQQF